MSRTRSAATSVSDSTWNLGRGMVITALSAPVQGRRDHEPKMGRFRGWDKALPEFSFLDFLPAAHQ
jgi:hypothetical protein